MWGFIFLFIYIFIISFTEKILWWKYIKDQIKLFPKILFHFEKNHRNFDAKEDDLIIKTSK